MSQGIITPMILSSSSSKLLVLRRRSLCAKNAHGWCGGERPPTNLGKKSQFVGYNTGKSLLCMETHVPVYVEGSCCKKSRVHADYMGRRFSRMTMGEEEGNPVVGYAQGRRRSCSSSSRRRIWDRNRNRCWRGRSTMTLIGPECGHLLFCTLSACAALAQVLETRTEFGARVSAPLLAMGTGLLLSGCRIVPPTAPAYDLVFALGMPMAVSLCLLETDVMQAFTDAGSTLKAFWFGAIGTVMGAVVAFGAVGHFLGPNGWKIASSLCASYVGGSVNYAATAQALGLNSPSMLAAGMAADNLAMAVYFGVIMSIHVDRTGFTSTFPGGGDDKATEMEVIPTVETLSLSMAAAAAACMIGNGLAAVLPPPFAGSGLAMMAVVASLISTAVAFVSGSKQNGSTIPMFAGSQSLGGVFMLLFFSVVGASTSVQEAVAGGWPLFIFILILFVIHLLVTLSLGIWFKLPLHTLLVASNANIGGPATAAAMASARRWPEMVRPALLVGTLGYTIGTAVGCTVGLQFLLPMVRKSLLLVF
ncbi:unnamed protein product [Sphagnum jensenii]|uniref:DUF819 domain-containing protein n=1 Tax=Sphagnum jensenii TaxID=128206 RepID=A0ABP1ASX9_9BRYO